MKLRFMLIACLFGLIVSGMFVVAQDDEEARNDAVFGLITSNRVVVRSGPDFAYPIVAQLAIDTSVEVLGRAGSFLGRFSGREWLNIAYGNRTGWVLARFVRIGRTFNTIPQTGLALPRNQDRRVPPEFDLSTHICDSWQGQFSVSGNFMAGDEEITFTFPAMQGAVNYSLVAEAPSGLRRTFDTSEPSITVTLGSLNREPGIYTWYVIPYWNDTTNFRRAQQLCVRRFGGTFEKPDTNPVTATPAPTATPTQP